MKYNVLKNFEANVIVSDNPYQFNEADLFDMALRINKKRRFLFVSKVLAKHLAVSPQIPRLTSHLLACHYDKLSTGAEHAFAYKIKDAIQSKQLANVVEQSLAQPIHLEKKTVIIGFAETATALGHAFFEKFTGKVQYVHTTREHLVDVEPVVTFEEEHSHATSHRVYADASLFEGAEEVILVDDEMTTGKTNCNIIRQLQQRYPHIKKFTVVAILDFRSQDAEAMMQTVADELGISIQSVALYKSTFTIQETAPLIEQGDAIANEATAAYEMRSFEKELHASLQMRDSYSAETVVQQANYYSYSGRFYLNTTQQKQLRHDVQRVAETLKQLRTGGPCLVLGTGEFMFVPMSIACEMGEDVKFHATTRSPIYANEQSLIYNKFEFQSAEFPGITNFLYNIPKNTYHDLFITYERILDERAVAQLVSQLKPYAQNIHIITLGGVGHTLYAR